MYPTHQEMMKVSQDTTLTPSQKYHELFKNSKTRLLSSYLDRKLSHPLSPNLHKEAIVVQINEGQTFTLRYPDNTYHILDLGTYEEIEGIDYIAVTSLEDLGNEIADQYFTELLSTEDTPLPFYHGGFIDEDLQEFFLNSYPN
jgi:hypothetical protein